MKSLEHRIIGAALGGVFLVGSVSGAAWGQARPSQDQQDAIVEALACEAIGARRQRMRCLEAALEQLSLAFPELQNRAQEVARADAELNQVQAEADFGASDLPLSDDERAEDSEDLRQIQSRAISTSRTLSGSLVFVLANGQVWEQLSSDRGSPSIPRTGEPYPVTLRRGFLGSHFLKVADERPAIRVQRIR